MLKCDEMVVGVNKWQVGRHNLQLSSEVTALLRKVSHSES